MYPVLFEIGPITIYSLGIIAMSGAINMPTVSSRQCNCSVALASAWLRDRMRKRRSAWPPTQYAA
jgi:hypothetical protein